MTSLRRRVEYLWKAARGQPVGQLRGRRRAKSKMPGSRRDPTIVRPCVRSFICVPSALRSVACLIVNEIEEIISAGRYVVRDTYISPCFSARFALARERLHKTTAFHSGGRERKDAYHFSRYRARERDRVYIIAIRLEPLIIAELR